MTSDTLRAPIATAELLAVGAELLAGETRDTNSGDLAAELTDLGVEVTRMNQLPDDLAVVSGAIREALQRADLIITTGGLGPTPDDLTRESIAAAVGEEPATDPELEAWLREIWSGRGLPFPKSNLKQAWLIPSSSALPNAHGTAPGWWVEAGSQVIIALPGPPRELLPMWRDHALPRLRERGLGIDRAVETLRLTGIGESLLAEIIGEELLRASNPRMATYARADSVDVRVSAVAEDGRSAAQIVDTGVARLEPLIGEHTFARGEDGWLEALTERIGTRRLATVEAGTAGYLGLLLGAAPWLARAEQVPDSPEAGEHLDTALLAHAIREQSGAEIGLAVVAYEVGNEMRVVVSVDLDGEQHLAERSVFRGGDAGRRRGANVAAAEVWKRLGA
jgi:nicotinamide-nucleotide amidase